MKLGKTEKQPADVLDYDVDYSAWLRDNETLSQASVTVSPEGLVLDAQAVANPIVKVWLSGGTAGGRYKVEVTATTSMGVVRQDEFIVAVKEY